MARLLHVMISPRSGASFSRRIGRELVASLRHADPHLTVVERDLAIAPIPHPDEAFVGASMTPEAERGDAERNALALSERLIGELEAADIVLLSTPMHNFTTPSVLKAWLDHIVRPNRTFRVTAAGKVGLFEDRPVLVVIACGGRFGEDSAAQIDFLSPYLRYVFGIIGLSSVEVLRLEELNRGREKIELGLEAARRWIEAQSARFRG